MRVAHVGGKVPGEPLRRVAALPVEGGDEHVGGVDEDAAEHRRKVPLPLHLATGGEAGVAEVALHRRAHPTGVGARRVRQEPPRGVEGAVPVLLVPRVVHRHQRADPLLLAEERLPAVVHHEEPAPATADLEEIDEALRGEGTADLLEPLRRGHPLSGRVLPPVVAVRFDRRDAVGVIVTKAERREVGGDQRLQSRVHPALGARQILADEPHVESLLHAGDPVGDLDATAVSSLAAEGDLAAARIGLDPTVEGDLGEAFRLVADRHRELPEGAARIEQAVGILRGAQVGDRPGVEIDHHLQRAAGESDPIARALHLGLPERRRGLLERIEHAPPVRGNLRGDAAGEHHVARPAEGVVDEHRAVKAAHATREVTAGAAEDVLGEADRAIEGALADEPAQRLALVVVVVLRGEEFAPRLLQLPRRVDVPRGVGATEEPRGGGDRFGGEELLLRDPAEARHPIAVLAEAHPVEDVVEGIATHRRLPPGDLADRGERGDQLGQGDGTHVEALVGEQFLQRRTQHLRAAHPVGGGQQLHPLHHRGARELLHQRGVEAPREVLRPLVQAQLVLRHRRQACAVEPLPPHQRELLLRHRRRVPRPLEEEGRALEAAAREDLRQLGKEVELLLPERARPHAEEAPHGAHPEDPLAHVRFPAVEEAVRLAVGAAHDLDRPRLHRRAQFGERLRILRGELLVPHAVEVGAAARAGALHQLEHVADRTRQHLVPPQPVEVHPVHVVAEGVVERLLHAEPMLPPKKQPGSVPPEVKGPNPA